MTTQPSPDPDHHNPHHPGRHHPGPTAGPSGLPGSVDQFGALGLEPRQAQVLAAVLLAEETTAGQLTGATGLSASDVSRALASLRRLGLVERLDGRRPCLVFVSPNAAAIAEQLSHDAGARRALAAEHAADASALALAALSRAAARTSQRGRPTYEILADPGTSWTDDRSHLRHGQTSHDQVLLGFREHVQFWSPSRVCTTRLIVAQPERPALADLCDALTRRQRRATVVVRVSTAPRAELLVLDAERLRVSGGDRHGRVHAWSRDPLHLDAAAQLFTSWWDEAAPVLHLDPTPIPPFDETDLDVDEWDPDDL